MNRSLLYIAFIMILSSCSLFRIDNYDEPSETLKGAVVDEGDPKVKDRLKGHLSFL